VTDGTYWNDGVTVSGCDGGADVAARFPGEGLLCQMHASDLKKKEETEKLQM
jgi:hypothetical protein